MADIRYTPVTNGQTFGDAGRIFESAAKNLNKATSGAADAFNTFRQGAIDARDQRTQSAISAIQGARTIDEYNALASQLNSPEALTERFGSHDTNKALDALRNQLGTVRSNVTDEISFNDSLADQKLNQFYEKNPTATTEDLKQFSVKENIPLPKTNAFASGVNKLTGQTERTKLSAQIAKEGRAQQNALDLLTAKAAREDKKAASKTLETTLSNFDATDDFEGFGTSSKNEAAQANAKLEALGVSVSERNRLFNSAKVSTLRSNNAYKNEIIDDFIKNLEDSQRVPNATNTLLDRLGAFINRRSN